MSYPKETKSKPDESTAKLKYLLS